MQGLFAIARGSILQGGIQVKPANSNKNSKVSRPLYVKPANTSTSKMSIFGATMIRDSAEGTCTLTLKAVSSLGDQALQINASASLSFVGADKDHSNPVNCHYIGAQSFMASIFEVGVIIYTFIDLKSM